MDEDPCLDANTPEINALSTFIILFSFIIVLVSQRLNKGNLITMITESDESFSKRIKADIIRIERGRIL